MARFFFLEWPSNIYLGNKLGYVGKRWMGYTGICMNTSPAFVWFVEYSVLFIKTILAINESNPWIFSKGPILP